MSLQDPLSDMFTRIRNGQQRLKQSVSMPGSEKKVAVAKVLEAEGYISGFETKTQEGKSILVVTLKYFQGKGVIESIELTLRICYKAPEVLLQNLFVYLS